MQRRSSTRDPAEARAPLPRRRSARSSRTLAGVGADRAGRNDAGPFDRAESRAASFFGRAEDLAAIGDHFAHGARLITLIGPPGVGKTRLAIRYGAMHGPEQAGGAWLLDLSEARTALDVVGVAATALGVALASTPTVEVAFVQTARALAARGPVFVVVDNAEHVIDAAAALVSAWRDHATSAKILVTSREPLRLPDEVRLSVEPLDAAAAVSLFEARARGVQPRFDLAPAERAIAAEIVERLDRLPLAVELAAARASVLTPAALLEQLALGLELSRPEARDKKTGKTSLRAAIAWSWNLLEAWEADALSQCALFAGGFTAEAAEAVIELAPGSPPVLDVLQSLYERSLLRPGPRFGLYASVRGFAHERVDASSRAAATLRHARYYAERAEAWSLGIDGRDAVACMQAFQLELDNMVAAHERTIATDAASSARLALAIEIAIGHLRPPTARLALLDGAVRAADSSGDPTLIASSHAARGAASLAAGRLPDALADARAARDVASASPESRAAAELVFAEIAVQDRHFDEALARITAAIDTSGAARRAGYARLITVRAGIEIHLRRFTDAHASLDEALAIQRREGNLRGEARVLAVLGELREQDQRDVEKTIALRERALALYRRIGDRPAEALGLLNIAYSCLELGQWERAQTFAEEALAVARPYGLPWLEAIASLAVATSLGMQARLVEAIGVSRHALGLARGLGHYLEALAWMNLGFAESLSGDVEAGGSALAAAEQPVLLAADVALAEVLEVTRGVHHLALAAEAAERGEAATVARLLRQARALATPRTAPGAPEPSDVRVLRRLLAVALEERAPAIEAAVAARRGEHAAGDDAVEPLLVHVEGRWFRPPGGEHIACAGRPILRRILVALAEAHARSPNRPLSSKELLAAGWPGERVGPDAARRRLQVMMWRLRELGLRRFLRADADGYLLDPAVRVEIVRVDPRM